MEFKYKLGENVNVKGNFNGGSVISRGMWETLAHPEATIWYVVRLGDKEITVSEAELS